MTLGRGPSSHVSPSDVSTTSDYVSSDATKRTRSLLTPNAPDLLAGPSSRPSPTDPLSEHRRRHIRGVLEQLPHPGSNGVNDVGTANRLYFGGRPDASARATVAPDPKSRAPCRGGPPSATNRRIQSPILHSDHLSNLSG